MKRFIVFKSGVFVDVERIVSVASNPIDGRSSVVHMDLSGSVGGKSEEASMLFVNESPAEVRALIQKALSKDVSFVSAQ